MSSNLESPLSINIRLPSYHPRLLEGLDIWIELGLISESQVQQLCREQLTCKLMTPPDTVAQANNDIVPRVNLIASPSPSRKKPTEVVQKPSVVAGMIQSLMAEISVRWLLFLGIFLVVVSSGVLAASQWERFPPSGQYGVLLGYTLSFFGISFWTGKQPNLRLTTQALLVVTQLLIPINFWAIDGFSLWQTNLGWLVTAIAAITLIFITVLIANSSRFAASLPNRKLRLVNILALSFLHLGWKITNFPLFAIYTAMVGTSILTIYQQPIPQNDSQTKLGLNLPLSIIIYALALLLSRGIFVAGVDITLLGLAIGICGWLVKNKYLGGGLLFIGWCVSVIPHPEQALGVSCLSLWVLLNRLKYNSKLEFAVLFAIGLQTNWLLWRLIPINYQNKIVTFATQITNSANEPWCLWSLGLLPYLVAIVLLTQYLYSKGKGDIAGFGEQIYLSFGTILTTIALVSPGVRSLNLFFSTIILASLIHYRLLKISLTNITAILTLCSFINWWVPSLQLQYWGIILLALMVAEWVYSVSNRLGSRGAWFIGYGLAAVSFGLFLVNLNLNLYSPNYQVCNWGAIWLVAPVTLTIIASRSTAIQGRVNSVSSIIALGIAQLLTLPLHRTRLLGLGVAAMLMFVNTGYLKTQQAALITVGVVISFITAVLGEGIPNIPSLSMAGWFVVGAGGILCLWVIGSKKQETANLDSNVTPSSVLSIVHFPLAEIYSQAANTWGCILFAIELLGLTLHSVGIYQGFLPAGFFYIIATLITLVAIVFRSWREPSNWAFYGIGWSLELLVAEVLAFSGKTTIKIAIANIALGLATQLFGEWWKRRHRLAELPSSFHVLPIIYAAFSVLFRVDTFTSWTGLFTLGVAIILVGIGRRSNNLKPWVYCGLIGVPLAAYELLFYQMLRVQGAYGDGLIAMAALGAMIMYTYRVLSPWLVRYLRLTSPEINAVANCHWVWSSGLLLVALTSPVAINRFIGLGTGMFLARYAIFQGKTSLSESNVDIKVKEFWVYFGLLEVAGVCLLLQDLPVGKLFTQHLLPWNPAIACIVAFTLYILPWERWGWLKKPWQNVAYVLPLLVIWVTWSQIYPVTLAIVGGFYLLITKLQGNFGFTYISIGLLNWALMRWFNDLRVSDILLYVSPIGVSLIYIAQFDPYFKSTMAKTSRHQLRLCGSGLICGCALISYQYNPFIPGILSLIAIFTGLSLRIRAFLYVGTAAFLITAIYQLVIFSLRYPFLKWVVGLLVGIGLIYVAANFETRSEQLNSLFRNTSDSFEEWE